MIRALVFVALLAGCAHEPCMTGFDLGAEVGQWDTRRGQTYAGGSVTVSFDTTGECDTE